MPKTHAVGIDLGTTYSAVAFLDEKRATNMVRNAEGEILTPSVVLFERSEIIVGKEAKKAAGFRPGAVAEHVKRDMGRPSYSRLIHGEKLPPEVIQAYILRKLKNDTIQQLSPSFKVVITVPAYFDEPRRKATADAGEMAGLDVLDIVNEPTAAALAFCETLGFLGKTGVALRPMKVLVYDLGGGTFDVTVVDLRPGDIRTLATDGDVMLGGHDWDMRLVDHAAEAFRRKHGADPRQDAVSLARLLRTVEEAKRTLSARAKASFTIEHGDLRLEMSVSRDEFEDLTSDLLERTAYTTRQVLAASRLKWSDIDRVLLVGGSTRMPMVSKMLEELTSLVPDHSVYPDEAVARGAAIFAGYRMSTTGAISQPVTFRVTDVNAHSLGIEGTDQRTGRRENAIIIPRNSPLPIRVTDKFYTKHERQRSVVVQVLEGESKLPEECSRAGRAVLRNLPSNLPDKTRIDVTYEYLTNGRLHVEAELPGSPHKLVMELERESGIPSAQLGRWKKVMSSDGGFDTFESMLEDVLYSDEMAMPAGPKQVVGGSQRQSPAAPVARAVATPEPGSLSPAAMRASGASTGQLGSYSGGRAYGGGSGDAAVGLAEPAPPPGQAAGEPEESQEGPDFTAVGESSRRRSFAWVTTIIGHLIASLLGLLIGYYILCWTMPQGNFLNLPLPGLPPTPAEKRVSPDAADASPVVLVAPRHG